MMYNNRRSAIFQGLQTDPQKDFLRCRENLGLKLVTKEVSCCRRVAEITYIQPCLSACERVSTRQFSHVRRKLVGRQECNQAEQVQSFVTTALPLGTNANKGLQENKATEVAKVVEGVS